MMRRTVFTCLASLLLAPLAGCGGGDDGATTSGTGGGSTTSSSGGTTPTAYQLDCEALSSLFLTTPTASVNDWAGYFTCYGLDHGCSGSTCRWKTSDLPDYLLSDDCATGATHSCMSGGTTVPYCATHANTGYVKVDCSTDGKIVLTGNGLPDHTLENYAHTGTLPGGGVGSKEQSVSYAISLKPTTKEGTVTLFSGPGNTPGIMINGVDLFNQFDGGGTVVYPQGIVDDCAAHPAPGGDYHYHSLPVCGAFKQASLLGSAGKHSGLFGLSMDGFPILGPYGFKDAKDGTSEVVRVQSCYKQKDGCDAIQPACYTFDADAYAKGECDLDECNGRVTAVPAALKAALGKEIYAYYFTLDAEGKGAFPYLPYCFRGEYTPSMMGGGPPGGGMGGPPGGGTGM